MCNLLCLFRRKDRAARRARNARLLEDGVKALSVLGRIDILRSRAENRNAHLHERLGQLDCGLSAELHNRAVRLLKVHNRFDILRGQGLKVELVRNVKVGRDRLRVVVDDNGLIALFPEGEGAVHRAEVELDALADANRAGAEHQNLLLRLRLLRLVLAVIDAVVVRGLRRKLRRAGIDHLKARVNLEFRALCLDLGLGLAAERRNHVIRELKALRIAEQLLGQRSSAELCLHSDQTVQLMDEPAIYLCQREDIVVREAAAQRFCNDPDAAIVDHAQLSLELVVVEGRIVIAHQAVHMLLERTYCLHERALKVRADGHYLTGRLHLRAERVLCRDKFIKGKTRHLDHAVVEHGLEGSVGLLGHRVLNLIQGVAERNLRRDLCDRIAGRLRSEGRRTADTRVHLNDTVLEAVRIQRVLHVAAAGDAELGDDVERGTAEHLILLVAEGLRGRNHDRVTRVHADRIQILHVADRNHIARAVTHDLVLNFFPARNAALHKHLSHAGEAETVLQYLNEGTAILRDAAAAAAERVCRAQYDRIADFLGKRDAVLDILDDLRRRDRLADLFHGLLKELSVLCLLDGQRRGADQADIVRRKEASLLKLHREIEARLAAEGRQHGVRLFLQN